MVKEPQSFHLTKNKIHSFNPQHSSSIPFTSSTKQHVIISLFYINQQHYTANNMASQTSSQKPNKSDDPPPQISWIRHVTSTCLQPATLLLTCICMVLAYKNTNWKWKRSTKETAVKWRPLMQRAVSMAVLHGGRMALQRIMDSQEARIDQATLENAEQVLRSLLDEEPLNFNLLQRTAAKLEMSGKEDEAVEMLQKAWEDAEKEGKPQEAYELQMILVEMLIYKGNYQDALKCKCLNDEEISDARRPLLKAIIYFIEGDSIRARECYKEFQEIQNRFHLPVDVREGSPLHGVVHDFQVFERIVGNLKREIEHARKMKQAYTTKT